MDDGKTVSLSRVYAPNEYVLYLSPKDHEQFRGYEQALLAELAAYLAEHAHREGYSLVSPPHVLLEEDADLSVGEFGIATRLVQPPAAQAPAPAQVPDAPAPPAPLGPPPAEAGGTRVYAPQELAQPAEPAERPAPERLSLVLAGVRRELDGRTVTLGRSKDCDLVVDDPSASRRHAEVRLDAGGYWVVDLGSTNGTEVNGKRVDRARLAPGDVITVGQTQLVVERVA
jgi:hypothetical protein